MAFMTHNNSLKEIRESLLMSKGELARKAGFSPLTIDRIEKGMPCWMETKRKIMLALGKDFSERGMFSLGIVFQERRIPA